MSQKTQPGSVESRVHDLKRTEFENILIKKLGQKIKCELKTVNLRIKQLI